MAISTSKLNRRAQVPYSYTDSVTTGSTITLRTGTSNTYTVNGNFNINGSNVTFGSGTYIFKGAYQFTVDSQSTLTGIGVTLVFLDPTGACLSQSSWKSYCDADQQRRERELAGANLWCDSCHVDTW